MIYVKEKNNKTKEKEKPRLPPKEYRGKSLSAFIPLLLAAVLFVLLLLFPANSSKGAFEGIKLCTDTLLPSLFPFMFVSSLFTSAVASAKNSRPSRRRKGQKSKDAAALSAQKNGSILSGACIQSLVLAAFGGYPVGAVTVNSLYKKGLLSSEQSRLMVYTAFGGGMGFLISYTGAALLHSRKAGLILFAAQLVTMGIIFLSLLCFYQKRKKGSQKNSREIPFNSHGLKTAISAKTAWEETKGDINTAEKSHNDSAVNKGTSAALPEKNSTSEDKSIFAVIFASVISAGKNAVNMCLIVILFSSAAGIILPFLSYNSILKDCFYCLWEVSAGVKSLAPLSPLWLTGFITGFGGICVHIQVFYAAGDVSFSKWVFLVVRIFQGLINSAAVFILTLVFPVEEKVSGVFSSVTQSPSPAESENPLKLLILIFACFCFLLSLGQRFVPPRVFTLLSQKLNYINRR